MTPANHALEKMNSRLREARVLASCGSLLAWDERTYMPQNGAKLRAEQMALVSGMVHERTTSPEMGEILSILRESEYTKTPDSAEAVNIRESFLLYDKQRRLPKEFVEEMSMVTSEAEHAWVRARSEKNFALFLPYLEKVYALKRRQADYYGWKDNPYDALIDDYEPGATRDSIARTFQGLRDELTPLLKAISESTQRPKVEIAERAYDISAQQKFGTEAAGLCGFDFASGRLDVTTHPFCSGFGPGDTRILTRYNPNRFNDAFFGIMHEAGHGMYEQGLNAQYFGLPMGESVSLGIHESQSRMWENFVGRSHAFWEYFFPKAQAHFSDTLKGVALDEFYGAINDVRPSFIRVEADEITYNLHIILRFELEDELLNERLKPRDLPAAWNERFTKFFGITPPDDALGCIQDVHWSAGLVGYFPTYALGNLYAAQLFAKADLDLGGLASQFRKGEFAPLKNWLNENIHRQGQRYHSEALVEKVTGAAPTHEPLMKHLRGKFSALYGLK